MLSFVNLNVVMLSVIMMSVVMLNVVMLSVVAPSVLDDGYLAEFPRMSSTETESCGFGTARTTPS
jgi:hypothetical protein